MPSPTRLPLRALPLALGLLSACFEPLNVWHGDRPDAGDAGGDVGMDATGTDAGDATVGDTPIVTTDVPRADVRDATPSDAGVFCDPRAPFMSPALDPNTVAAALSASGSQVHVSMSPNGLELLFDQSVSGGPYQIYLAARAALDRPFANPTHLALSPTETAETGPAFDRTGDTVYFCVGPAGGHHIEAAARTAPGSISFGPPQQVSAVNALGDVCYPAIDRATGDLYFTSLQSGHTDLYVAHYNAAQSRFDAAQPLTALNTPDDETAPSVTPDGLALYFARNRVSTGDPPHLFRAFRNGTADSFLSAAQATELNDMNFQEVGITFDPTGCTAVFTTDRGSGTIGDFDLWTAHKSPSP